MDHRIDCSRIVRHLRRLEALERARAMAEAGDAAGARELIKRLDDGRPFAAIEVDSTQPYLADGKPVSEEDD